MFFDPLYLIMFMPALLLSLYASIKVKSTYKRFSQVPTMRGITGAQAAGYLLDSAGIHDVKVELYQGFLTDHYDPGAKVLRLSEGVYRGDSLASVGVAAHEVGHAIQHANGYMPLKLRSMLVPVTNIGSNLAWPLLIFGFMFHSVGMINAGLVFFTVVMIFQLVTLPVEFNASSRALQALPVSGILSHDEVAGARKVLTVAAMTYVAAAATAVMQLLYFLIRSGILGGQGK